MTKQDSRTIVVYTRVPQGDYTISLANSVHFAYLDTEGCVVPLNQNYGILFAEGVVDSNDVIREKGAVQPRIARDGDGFRITALRTEASGGIEEDTKEQVLLWTSKDLIRFTYHGPVSGERRPPEDEPMAIIPEGMLVGNSMDVDDGVFRSMLTHWTPICHTETHGPAAVTVTSKEEAESITATAVYSDGSTVQKQVEWELQDIDFATAGRHTVSGRVKESSFPFPLAKGYADPVILPWKGKYYYLATNDNKNDIGLYVRRGDSLADLFAPGFEETVILGVDEEKGFVQTFWAPEFHWIGGELYILFAVGGKQWAPQCHCMKLQKDGDIMNPAHWHTPERIRRGDGRYLTEDGITLDMTYFETKGASYVVWSYRRHIGTALDTGSMLYIAPIDPKNPAVLTGEPVLLSRPLYGWENIQGTINNEGPYPLITNERVYIAYSGGAAGGYTYAVGLLSIPPDGDVLDASQWHKLETPALSYYSLDGIYGAGHNSFFRDYDGTTYIAYHGEETITPNGQRCTGLHRLHFDRNGYPRLDLTPRRDLSPALTRVTMEMTVDR